MADDRFQIVFLVDNRHFHSIVIAAAMNTSAREIKGIHSVAESVKGVEIIPAEMVSAVESMAYDGHTLLSFGFRRRFYSKNLAVSVFNPNLFYIIRITLALYGPTGE